MKKNEVTRWTVRIVIIMVMVVIPLAIKVQEIRVTGSVLEFWGGFFSSTDMFHRIKSQLLIGTSVIALLTIMLNYKRIPRLGESYSAKLVMLFSCSVLASTIGSSYFDIAVFGLVQRYEGMIVYFGYVFLFYFGYLIIEKKDEKWLIGSVAVVVAAMSIIGAFQYFRMDLLKSEWIKPFLYGKELMEKIVSVKYNFASNTVYGTLYNPNYLGSFSAIVAPMLLMGYKKFEIMWKRYLVLGLGFASLLLLLVSHSSAGIVGILGFVSVYLLKKIKFKNIEKKKIYIGVIIILLISIIMSKEVHRFTDDIFKSFQNKEIFTVESIEIDENIVHIELDEQMRDFDIDYNFEEGEVELFDDNGQKIEMIQYGDKKEFFSEEPTYQFFSISSNAAGFRLMFYPFEKDIYRIFPIDKEVVNGEVVMHLAPIKTMETGKKVIIVSKLKKLEIYVYGSFFKDNLEEAESFLFENYEHAGSGRGYIWSRSLPMIKDNLIIGVGPDVYAYKFPQWDVLGKLNYMSQSYGIVDKPHSTYLQIAINMGLMGLVMLLLSIGLFLIKGWKNLNSPVFAGIYFAVIAYWLAAFFNDSVVSVAPMFWLLFGYGVSLNNSLSNEEIVLLDEVEETNL